jgi:hypothetical protein
MNRELFPEGQCPDCQMYGGQWIDGKHTCTVYDGPVCDTPWCDQPTVFVVVAAPGTGRGYSCKAGHFNGYVRELTLDDVR